MERGAEIKARDRDNQTPLHLAGYCNSAEAVKLLVERGAGIESRNGNNRTPLQDAASGNS